MQNNLKGHILTETFSWLKISGLTSNPSPEDYERGLRRMENMMAELLKTRSVNLNYNFEDEPDPNSPHNVEAAFWNFMETNTAMRLLADYGLTAAPELVRQATQSAASVSNFSGKANLREVPYPSRQPRGNGNTFRHNRWRRFYPETVRAPADAETNRLIADDVQDYVEHFDSILAAGEDIASYTIEATSGLSIESDSLETPDVLYRIKGLDGSEDYAEYQQVKIVITTTDGRVLTRVVDFNLEVVDDF